MKIGVRVHPGDAVVAQTPSFPQVNLGVPYQPDAQVPVAVVPALDKGYEALPGPEDKAAHVISEMVMSALRGSLVSNGRTGALRSGHCTKSSVGTQRLWRAGKGREAHAAAGGAVDRKRERRVAHRLGRALVENYQENTMNKKPGPMKHRTAAGGARASVPRVAGTGTGALVARRVRVAREVIKRNECTIRGSSTPGIVFPNVLIKMYV